MRLHVVPVLSEFDHGLRARSLNDVPGDPQDMLFRANHRYAADMSIQEYLSNILDRGRRTDRCRAGCHDITAIHINFS